ncbi:MFS transporter [Antrihabitans cavernicola]|uniref:MFS transporter n=1 Tax=Antrihabitans cavernicola TaxID=2495913 RepID=A0A5A7SAV6_9NOCA|nr:MFS transporter [Spelaeibacter cavernicola]KAA0022429.1 MFS transporter [Spelaeibacter cavernicola]
MLVPIQLSPRRARASVFGIFGLNGFLFAMWVVHIPSITQRTGVSNATLGGLLLVLAAGALIGMRIAGPLADRFGSRLLTGVAALGLSAAVLGPGLVHDADELGIALGLFGFFNGALDVAMNSQAVEVERLYRRPIMSAFHALYSCGGLVGSLIGAATLRADWNLHLSLALAALLGLVVVGVCCIGLLPHLHTAKPAQGRTRMSRKALALGLIAFAMLLSEGVANDWSTLQIKEHLSATDATAALAFGAFSVMMTIGRFGADRIAGALGPVAIVRYGTIVAAVGMAIVVVSGWVPLTLFGWALFGLGLSGCIPQIFTAAGNLGTGAAGANMSRVFSMGYLGLLAGPAVIGWLTKLIPLNAAMAVPLAAVLITCAAAGVVRPSSAAPVHA